MKGLYKKCLFNHHILVNEGDNTTDDWFHVIFSLAHFFNIKIDDDTAHLATKSMIATCQIYLGVNVPAPFYNGFPQSVLKLTKEELLFDQMYHYFTSYGMGCWDEPGYSVMEEDFKRSAFNEKTPVKEFTILTEEEAVKKLGEIIDNLLASSRPLNDVQYELFTEYTKDYKYVPKAFASKNTLIKYLIDTRDLTYVKFMWMSDVIKLVDEMNWRIYQNRNIKKLGFCLEDRRFVSSVMDILFELGRIDVATCHEKKKIWCGLLHHIHYQPKTKKAKDFCYTIRNKGNLSAYSRFEEAMSNDDPVGAANILAEEKGITTVLRNLEYLLSRCINPSQVGEILRLVKQSKNVIVLIQLLFKYTAYQDSKNPRTFAFTKYNQLRVHKETEDECSRRRTHLGDLTISVLKRMLKNTLKEALKDKLGKVYIDEKMTRYALPIQNNTSQGGFGVLSTGSRLPIPKGKKVRAFTYWEKVNDIDLSCFGIEEDGTQTEFSWRTMAGRQSKAITFSGDETRGYNGGSEYFDIDLDVIKHMYPKMKYIIFADNVYTSGYNFTDCYCTAGYMLRDEIDSGEVYEPKTVESSYRINCESRFAYLFGIDLDTREMVWLNVAREGQYAVAGATEFSFLLKYFYATECINMHEFFSMMASEIVDDPTEADVVVTNKVIEGIKDDTEIIREYDFDKILAYLNT